MSEITLSSAPEERLRRARVALEGLSVGDALGDYFFRPAAEALIESRAIPNPPWRYTDDTNMALSIYENLRLYGSIQQDALAQSFARHYHPFRGYGAAMHGLLTQIQDGTPWKEAASSLFSGQGSYGNGAAMRVAPLGAYFADDLKLAAEQARLSAEITHMNPEGIAGAIAIAVATGLACQLRQKPERLSRKDFIDRIFPYIPGGFVREKIRHARNLAAESSVTLAVSALGNGSQISAQDTVPFVLWSAGEYLNNYEDAIWQTISGYGDIDTTCAMVGGIVASYVGAAGIPAEWIQHREPLPGWALGEPEQES